MIALVGTLAGLCPVGAAWSQTAPPFSQLLRQVQGFAKAIFFGLYVDRPVK